MNAPVEGRIIYVVDDDDASTVLILAGAGLGAYGLYLRFR